MKPRDRGNIHGSLAAIVLLAPMLVWGVTSAASDKVPDPCSLITNAELVQIAGPIEGAPRKGDVAGGEVSCEFTPVKGIRWISIMLHDGDLAAWKRRNGGSNPQSLPEFGNGAFVNLDDDTVDLFVKKGAYVLRIGLPGGSGALDVAKAITRKALPRL